MLSVADSGHQYHSKVSLPQDFRRKCIEKSDAKTMISVALGQCGLAASWLLCGQFEETVMVKHEKDVSIAESTIKLWDLRSMKNRVDLSSVLYLVYVFGVLALGVFFLTLA